MPVLEVVPAQFRDAATTLGETVAAQLRLSWLDLVLTLQDCAGMAGSDDAGAAWGNSYEAAARSAGQAVTTLLNGCSHLGALLDQTAVNYELAESASVTGGAHTVPAPGRFGTDWCDWLDDVAPVVEPGVPPPPGFEVLMHLIQRAWPNGHQDRLRRAGDAWRQAGARVRDTLDDVVTAYRSVYLHRVPESAAASTVLDTIGDQIVTVAQGLQSIGDACDDYAHHLDEAHHQIISELRDFAIWTAGIETAGGVLAVVTFGLSEAAAQGTEAVMMARFANTIRTLIDALVTAARSVGLAVDAAVARVELVAVRLRPLLAQHLEQVRIAMASDRGELVIGRTVPSRLAAGETATTPTAKALQELEDSAAIGPASETWGNMETLDRHFAEHGHQFGAQSPEEYARMAAKFLRRALREKIPKKIDYENRTVRFYDPATNTYASYRFDGTTRTFFKPKPKTALRYWRKQDGVES